MIKIFIKYKCLETILNQDMLRLNDLKRTETEYT